MGRKYVEEYCDNCKEETIHRFFKRFGAVGDRHTGRRSLRREVRWCLNCQRRIIKNSRKGTYVKYPGKK